MRGIGYPCHKRPFSTSVLHHIHYLVLALHAIPINPPFWQHETQYSILYDITLCRGKNL